MDRINFTPSREDAAAIEKVRSLHPLVARTDSGAIRFALEFFLNHYNGGGITRRQMQEEDLELSRLIAEKLKVTR